MTSSKPHLLNDEQMRQFLTQGYLLLKTDFSSVFHQKLTEQLNRIYEKEGNPGNNLLPRVREIQQVFDHPTITGALTSVLGPNYLLHAHRHGHYNAASEAGKWHKDSYWGYKKMRHHRPWWAMIMYFPQDTPPELGPTGVMPGTQHHEKMNFEAESEVEVLAAGEAGTFVLIHYDIWHRSTPNVLGKPRFMLKFEFMRTQAPVEPSWECKAPLWQPPLQENPMGLQHNSLCEDSWNWLCGKPGSLADTAEASNTLIADLKHQAAGDKEPEALEAAYALARTGTGGISALTELLHDDSLRVSRLAAYGLSAAGEAAIPPLTEALVAARMQTVVHSVFALGELRCGTPSVLSKLMGLLDHEAEAVRYTVAESLGMIGSSAVTGGLIRCLQDESPQVRFTAGLALCRVGKAAAEAVPQLELALDDENRYVRAHAAEALRYIGTEHAKDVLIRSLFSARWCATTTADNPFYP